MKSLQLSQPHLIVVTGIPGSGKTFFAEKFADMFNAPLVGAGQIIEHAAVTEDEAEALVLSSLEQLVRTRSTIVVDGSADTKQQRLDLARIAKQADYTVLTVWVQTDPLAAEARSTKKPRGGTARHTPESFEAYAKRFAMPLKNDNLVVISGKHTHATQTKAVLAKLTAQRSQQPLSTASAPERPTPGPRRGITIR